MAAFLEFHVKGGGCALVEAGMIGAVMAKGHDAWKIGTAEAPTLLVLRAGETIEVIGVSAGGTLGRMYTAKKAAKDQQYNTGMDIYVDWLEAMEGGTESAADRKSARS